MQGTNGIQDQQLWFKNFIQRIDKVGSSLICSGKMNTFFIRNSNFYFSRRKLKSKSSYLRFNFYYNNLSQKPLLLTL